MLLSHMHKHTILYISNITRFSISTDNEQKVGQMLRRNRAMLCRLIISTFAYGSSEGDQTCNCSYVWDVFVPVLLNALHLGLMN